MTDTSLIETVSKLEGLPAWEPLIGPCGITLEFGSKLNIFKGLESGDFSLWAQCEIKVSGHGKLRYPRCYPVKEDQELLDPFIITPAIMKAAVDEKDNSLRLLLHEDVLLSVYPAENEDDGCWLLFDHTQTYTRTYIVTRREIRIETATV